MHRVGHTQRRTARSRQRRRRPARSGSRGRLRDRARGPGRHHAGRPQHAQRQHAFFGLVNGQRRRRARLVELRLQRRGGAYRLCRDAQVFQRMAQIGQHVAVGAITVLVAAAPEDRRRHHDRQGVVGPCGVEAECTVGQRGVAQPLQRVRPGVVVPQARGHAIDRAHGNIQLGGEQRPGRRRGAKGDPPAAPADAGGVPKHRSQRGGIEGAPGRPIPHSLRRRQRQAGLARVVLEGRRRVTPVHSGRAAQQAGAGMGRELVKLFDQRQCRGRAVAGATRTGIGTGCGLDAQLGAAMSQPEHEGHTRHRHPAEQAQGCQRRPPAAARPRNAVTRRGRAALPQVLPHDAEVECQVQHQQQHRRVTEQVMPVEHRQLLVGHPEEPQACGAQHIG